MYLSYLDQDDIKFKLRIRKAKYWKMIGRMICSISWGWQNAITDRQNTLMMVSHYYHWTIGKRCAKAFLAKRILNCELIRWRLIRWWLISLKLIRWGDQSEANRMCGWIISLRLIKRRLISPKLIRFDQSEIDQIGLVRHWSDHFEQFDEAEMPWQILVARLRLLFRTW